MQSLIFFFKCFKILLSDVEILTIFTSNYFIKFWNPLMRAKVKLAYSSKTLASRVLERLLVSSVRNNIETFKNVYKALTKNLKKIK